MLVNDKPTQVYFNIAVTVQNSNHAEPQSNLDQ